MNNLINKYSKEIVGKLGDNLESLILVGSYSRDEEIGGLSDIEFWAVVKDLAKVNKPQLDNNVSLGFTTRKHLVHLKAYIYTLEVKKYGKIVYGDTNILKLIPDYSFGDIAPIDGFILLNNRITEQLILLSKIKSNQIINQYDFDKAYIQLVNSLLVFNRKYRSLYPEKLLAFRNISKDSGLLSKVEEAFAFIKRKQSEIASPSARNDINCEEALNKWLEVRSYFKKVWLLEKGLFGKLLFKPMQFWIYYKASKLYFSNKYDNKVLRDQIIKMWERFVK